MSIVNANMAAITVAPIPPRRLPSAQITCSASTPRRRGFGANRGKTNQPPSDENNLPLQKRKAPPSQSSPLPNQAPGLSSQYGGNNATRPTTVEDLEFEDRLKAVRRLAVEQKKADQMKEFAAIDYDSQSDTEDKSIGLGTKIGVGVAVVIFGLVFALGDFIPSFSDSPSEETSVAKKDVPEEERAILQSRLKEFEATLATSPADPIALEGAAVTLAELGEYTKAASELENLMTVKADDPDVYQLLAEVKFELKDYEGSVAAYKKSSEVYRGVNFEVLRGLTNALIAAKRPGEAVEVLMASRNVLNSKQSDGSEAQSSISGTESQTVDPVQIDLLLGKAYSEWGHLSDAISVYDRLISSHPEDFRGYLAKGIILNENGNTGDARRMFIQARFFAPEKAKALVDRYSRR